MNTQVIHDQTQEVPAGFIFTTLGAVAEERLEKRVSAEDSGDAVATATEYWLNGECVRRDVNLALKPRVFFDLVQQEL